jgi:two-component system, NarL family, sensor histidine kinase DesK
MPATPRPRGDLAILMTVCWCGFSAFGLVARHAAHLGWGIALLGAIAVLQSVHCRQSYSGRRPKSWPATVALQALFTFVPVMFLGAAWVGAPGLLAATLLFFLRPLWGWLGCAFVITSLFTITWLLVDGPQAAIYLTLGAIVSCLGLFGLTRLTGLVGQLRAARTDIVRLAVAEERERVAADLSDVLGYSLTAIASKGERTFALMAGDDPHQAREELATMLELSRQALDDVRAIAQRYQGQPGRP